MIALELYFDAIFLGLFEDSLMRLFDLPFLRLLKLGLPHPIDIIANFGSVTIGFELLSFVASAYKYNSPLQESVEVIEMYGVEISSNSCLKTLINRW